MPASKKKTYLAILALGGCALTVDRLVIPAATEAEPLVGSGTTSAARGASATTSPPKDATPVMEQSIPDLPFPRNLPTWDAHQEIRDIFASEFANAMSPDSRQGNGREPREGHGTCAGLIKQHRLDAVLVQETLRIAVIDGVWVRIGQDVEGCNVLEVDGNKVRFRCRDGETMLSLTAIVTPGGH